MNAATRLTDLARRHPAPPEKVPERLGQPTLPRPEGWLVWMHAQRAEQFGAAQVLLNELSMLRDEPVHGLLTSISSEPPPPPVAEAAIHQLAPGDTAGSVARFLDHWRPDAGIVLGLPDRPQLVSEARNRGIPLFLAFERRGRSDRGKPSNPTADILGSFKAILAPSAAEAQQLQRIVAESDRVLVAGPLSDAAIALPCSQTVFEDLRDRLGGRPVWLAAGITEAELPDVEAAMRRTIRAAHRLLLVVVPRNVGAGARFAGEFAARGWRTALRSEGEEPDESVQIYVADTEEELGLWYRLAPITFLGGSLDPEADATDPFAPAALGSAIIHGPHVGVASRRIEKLREAGATEPIEDGAMLGDAVFRLLAPDKAASLAHAGWVTTSESAHAIERLAEIVDLEFDIRSEGADSV